MSLADCLKDDVPLDKVVAALLYAAPAVFGDFSSDPDENQSGIRFFYTNGRSFPAAAFRVPRPYPHEDDGPGYVCIIGRGAWWFGKTPNEAAKEALKALIAYAREGVSRTEVNSQRLQRVLEGDLNEPVPAYPGEALQGLPRSPREVPT